VQAGLYVLARTRFPAWHDTGKLPATPADRPPADPGMVKVSVPEARRLARLG